MFALLALISACGNEDEGEPENRPPAFTGALQQAVDENNAAVFSLTLSDPDGDAVSVRISGGPDAALFSLSASTRTLSFLQPPDFEDPRDQDADNVYEVHLVAEDAAGASRAAVALVAVRNVAEAPVIQAPAMVEQPEETALAFQVSAYDPDGEAVSYSIEGGDDGGLFSIASDTGILRFDQVPDFELPRDADGNNYHDVLIGARDPGGKLSTHALIVRVTEVNEAPLFTSPDQFGMPENEQLVDTVTATDVEGEPLSFAISGGADASLFRLDDQTGELRFAAPPDFEQPADADGDNHYELRVSVTDYRDAVSEQDLAVAVTDRVRDIRPVLVFPPHGAHFGGRVSEHALVGRLTDLEGGSIAHDDINYIEVDGTRVAPDADDASLWHATIAAVTRNRSVPLEVSLSDGSVHQSSIVLRNAPFFDASGITVDPAANRVLFPGERGTGRIVGVDLATYERFQAGECAGIHRIDDLVLEDSGNRAIAAVTSEGGAPELWRVDMAADSCSLFSGNGEGSGPALNAINGMVLDEDAEGSPRVLVLDDADNAVMAVDVTTGARSVLSGNGRATGPSFGPLSGITMGPMELNAVIASPGTDDALFEMDLASGDRTIISQAVDLTPTSPVAVSSLDDEAYVVDTAGDIQSASLIDGQATLLTPQGMPGDSDYLGLVRALEVDASSGRLVISADSHRALSRILFAHLDDGEKTLVTDNRVGEGPAYGAIHDMSVDLITGRAFVLSEDAGPAIVETDLETGARTAHPLDYFRSVQSIEYDAVGDRLLVLGEPVDGSNPFHLVEITLPGYGVSTVSRFDAASGPDLVTPDNIARGNSGGPIWLIDEGLGAVLSIDPVSGDHAVLSDAARGVGPLLDGARDIIVDSARNRLIVADRHYGLIAVDLDTGDRADLVPPEPDGSHPDAVFESIALDDKSGEPVVTGVGNGEVSEVNLVTLTSSPLVSLSPPPGQSQDEMPAIEHSEINDLSWIAGNSGRLIVVTRESGQWGILSR